MGPSGLAGSIPVASALRGKVMNKTEIREIIDYGLRKLDCVPKAKIQITASNRPYYFQPKNAMFGHCIYGLTRVARWYEDNFYKAHLVFPLHFQNLSHDCKRDCVLHETCHIVQFCENFDEKLRDKNYDVHGEDFWELMRKIGCTRCLVPESEDSGDIPIMSRDVEGRWMGDYLVGRKWPKRRNRLDSFLKNLSNGILEIN